ncbi:hypothetical protein DV711_11980 [Motiliproteus coralliicola]|uniref:Uncharacterized protein n=1 Tax=Motiliproteus coralliicola TaxID=2283196 RepID=A0A369WJH2_9GAMM|nr:hypothetical protein DV711_11980 [Motiliproteus coralliicola]
MIGIKPIGWLVFTVKPIVLKLTLDECFLITNLFLVKKYSIPVKKMDKKALFFVVRPTFFQIAGLELESLGIQGISR